MSGMKARPRTLPVLLAVLLAAACAPAPRVAQAPPATAAAAATSSGVDLAGIDRSVAPGDDFFAWANGGWMKATEIPADRSSWGSGGEMTERTARRTAELIAGAATSKPPAGSEARKIGDTYSTFLDEAAIEAKGMSPLKPQMNYAQDDALAHGWK